MPPFGEVNSPLRPVLGRPISPDNPAALTGDGFPQAVEGAVKAQRNVKQCKMPGPLPQRYRAEKRKMAGPDK